MKQLCERYFYRRPLFLNVDIEGYGYQALNSNDWSNQLCNPDIIFSENNWLNAVSGLPQTETILTKNGYKKWEKDKIQGNDIFIRQKVFE